MDRHQRFESEALPHLKRLFGVAYRMTGNVADAEDLVQETFLRAYRGFHRFASGTNARAWLITILQRVRIDALRRAGRAGESEPLPEDGPAVPAPQERTPLALDLERGLASVPEPFKTAVILRDVEELSYEEIAAAVGAPIGTVMSRIHRGRAFLRSVLSAEAP